MKAAIALLGAFLALPVCAGEMVVHLGSQHGSKTYALGDREVAYNNVNPGVGVIRDDGWMAGIYFNSYRKPTLYAGRVFEASVSRATIGAVLALGTGYAIPTGKPLALLASFTASVRVTDTLKVRVMYLPPLTSETVSVTHVMLGYKF